MADIVEISKQVETSKVKQPLCNPLDAFDDTTQVLKKIKEKRGHPLFVLAVDGIDEDICHEVYKWKSELKEVGKENLDILIHSVGGDLTSCYNVARLFCRYLDSWAAIVPEYAASGATLICLGSCNIVMSDLSRLSPLDPQVISKRREKFFQSERQSPLEAFQAVRYLRQFSLESLDAIMMWLLRRQVDPKLALETAGKLAIQMAEPIMSKIEPYDIGAFALDSQVAIEYCKRISNPRNKAKKTQRNVDPIVLVETYPAHEFLIDVEEARALKFSVSEPSQEIDRLLDDLLSHLRGIEQYVGLVP